MATEENADRPLKFYGTEDYGTYFQIDRAAMLLDQYRRSLTVPVTPAQPAINEILALHNARFFAENDLFPQEYGESQRSALKEIVPRLRASVARFFNALDDTTFEQAMEGLSFEYHSDTLKLISQFQVYKRCSPTTILAALLDSGVDLGSILAERSLVQGLDQHLREKLLATSVNATHLVRKYLQQDAGKEVHLPSSFTRDDARALFNEYLDSDEAHLNIVELISLARVREAIGIDAKTKLKAKRRHAQLTNDFFRANTGINTGCEVSISRDLDEALAVSQDGLETKLTYSEQWLLETLDYPSVFNNFIHLFGFTDRHMLLTLPSQESQLGVFERFMSMTGKESYRTGAAFNFMDNVSFLQVWMYHQFLSKNDVTLEEGIAWFFSTYLTDEFGADGFRFVASSKSATYLEKCRHIFAEMESVIRQFSLYVENGEIDTGLLAIVSEPVRYKMTASLVNGKYAYASSAQDIHSILHLLFSDQSGLTYISDALKASDAMKLIARNVLTYETFADYQKPQIDYLIRMGILEDTGARVQFTNVNQVSILRDLFRSGAASYYHYSPESQASIDAMVQSGWLMRRTSLLTEAEGSYFNYYLNQSEFSNGPDLRNRYLHGSHVDPYDENEHARTYIFGLRLLIALVIKLNDDFVLFDSLT